MEQNELVVFENFSILNQKAMALPIGKVSIRQVLLITMGFFLATIVYLATTDLMYAGVSFAPFVIISMINTKIVSLDQIIRNNISFLIRGTSLSKKYLNSLKSKSNDSSQKVESKITPIKEKKKQLFSLGEMIKSIESIILKKPKNKDDDEENSTGAKTKIKNHSVILTVHQDNNFITLSNLKGGSNKFSKEKILNYLESSLDGVKLEPSDYQIKKGIVTIFLHKSKKYSIKVNNEKITVQ
ncbi:MAG: hypothetical protein OEL52_01190 [Nitrosopumilus sp.]|nr:hypothetical protein [Nitrosopumilus sp.]